MKSAANYLSQKCPTHPAFIDRLIVSAYLYMHQIGKLSNRFLSKYVIGPGDEAYPTLMEFVEVIRKEKATLDIEDLIELFEFVVSPEDKVITGAVYTPVSIRNYLVTESFSKISDLGNVTACDPACGCSGFLYTAAKAIKTRTNKSYSAIFKENIFGLDIQEYSITRSKLLLTLFALSEGELAESFEFNLFHGNALTFEWSQYVRNFQGFQVMVGNPPYVCSRNMEKDTLVLLDRFSVTKSGHPDLYIPFFEIGYELLADKGILGFITVNTFIKSINGRALRSYFANNKIDLKIINFGGEQIFKDKNTYTCLCFLRRQAGPILYTRTLSSSLAHLTHDSFFEYSYDVLNHHDGWNLVDSSHKNEFINRIESVGTPFKNLFNTRNGIATLKNDVYKFKPERQDAYYYYMIKDGVEYPIEKSICRKIINANKIKNDEDLVRKEEQIIFPYIHKDGAVVILSEEQFESDYPYAYQYLKKYRKILNTRDKGNVKKYEAWYAYGRRQSMETYAYKLFFPHICERPTFVISRNRDLLFYNGIAVISDSLRELRELKSLLESDIFFSYIKSTTKDYSSGYISMSRNYIKNFGIPQLTKKERAEMSQENFDANAFWENVYARAAYSMQNVKAVIRNHIRIG